MAGGRAVSPAEAPRLQERLAVVEAQMLRVHADLVEVVKELRKSNDERATLSRELAVLNERLAQLRPPPSSGQITVVGGGAAAAIVALYEAARAVLLGR